LIVIESNNNSFPGAFNTDCWFKKPFLLGKVICCWFFGLFSNIFSLFDMSSRTFSLILSDLDWFGSKNKIYIFRIENKLKKF